MMALPYNILSLSHNNIKCMETQQFKIKISISTKLLLIISFLLTIPIIFLNYSAIHLFRTDKIAYVYNSQATTVLLTGREFVSYIDAAFGTLRLILGSAEPQMKQVVSHNETPLTEEAKKTLEFYLGNQRHLDGIQLYLLNHTSNQYEPVYQHYVKRPTDSTALQAEALVPIIQNKQDEFTRNGYAFINLSEPGKNPVLGILLASQASNQDLPSMIAIGFANLSHFLVDALSSVYRFQIINQHGERLFHSDIKKIYFGENLTANPLFKTALGSKLNSGAMEFIDGQNTRMLGSYYKPGFQLIAMSEIPYDTAMQATQTMTEKFIALGLASISLMIILGIVFAKRITNPILRLFKATKQVSAGNFNIDLPLTSSDEIGALTHSFQLMSQRILELLNQMLDKARVEKEIEIARTVQQSLFPPASLKNQRMDIVSHYISASECGGDWWGYFHTAHNHVFAIADATGHGLPSALMTAAARSCFSVIEKLIRDNHFLMNPAEILKIANRVVYDSARGKIMMTCFIGIFDFEQKELVYSNAGHNPPWLISPDKQSKISSLVASGVRLGEAPEVSQPFEVKRTPFGKGDLLFLYTDGLLEGANKDGKTFGKKRARAVLEKLCRAPIEQIKDQLLKEFLEHHGEKPFDDDITMALGRVISE